MRILVHSPVGSTGGYARDGVGLIEALVERDHLVDLSPGSVLPPIPGHIAQLLTYPISKGYDLELHHLPPMGALPNSPQPKAKKRVLWTMWEWSTMPKDVPGFEQAKYVSSYDHVVAYTSQTLEAFKEAKILKEDVPTSVLQGGLSPHLWDKITEPHNAGFLEKVGNRAKDRGTFRFAMVGVLSSRKNPWTVLRAFNELKEELGDAFDAELILKTGFPVVPSDYNAPGVTLVNETNWTDQDMKIFYWSIDCLINCAWGEGKDLPALEATMCGVPTILNANPGHKGWVHPGIQKLLPATHMKMDLDYKGYFTSVEDIKEAMLEEYNNRAAGRRRADQLATYVGKRVSWDHKVQKLGEEIGLPL